MTTAQEKENHVLSYKNFRRFLPFNALIYLGMYMRSAFLTGYGAAWFAGCKTVKSNDNCDQDGDYDTFNFYFSISNSMVGLFAFISAGIIGHLSDIYGRKTFLYFQIITSWIPYIIVLFTNNMYIFLGLLSLLGLNGSLSPLCPVQLAYISDVLPSNKRISGFGTVLIIGGVIFLIGTGISFIISTLINDHFNFYVINICFLMDLLYLFKFLKEPNKTKTKTDNHIKQKQLIRFNPFYPFSYLWKNSVVLWVSLSSSFTSLLLTGLVDIMVVIFSDIFNSSEQQSNTIAFITIIGFNTGMMMGPIIFLPVLKKYLHFTDFQILIFALLLSIGDVILMVLILFIHSYYLIFVVSFIFGISVLYITAYNSILTMYCNENEHGIGLGVMASCNAISTIIAPFGFAVSYTYLSKHHVRIIIFGVAVLLGVIGLLCCIPLKYAINSSKQYVSIEANDKEKTDKLLVNADTLNDNVAVQPILSTSLSLQPAS